MQLFETVVHIATSQGVNEVIVGRLEFMHVVYIFTFILFASQLSFTHIFSYNIANSYI